MKFRIIETAHYLVEAKDEEEALEKFLNSEDPNKEFFDHVEEREVVVDGQGCWKIQMAGAHGWGDVKETEDDGETYVTCTYETYEEAAEELAELREHDKTTNYRIVETETPEDINFY